MKNRIKELRLKKGLTQGQLGELVNLSHDAVAKIERGDRRLKDYQMEAFSVAFGVSTSELFARSEASTVPLVGYVGAGAEVIPIDDCAQGASLEEIEAPQGLNLYGYVAVRVRGDSMYPRYFENEVIAFKRNVDWSDECLNKECVVKLKDGRCFVKIVRAGSKDGLFTLESFNAPLIYDVEIEWACCKLVRL